jgi:hypothetical protein
VVFGQAGTSVRSPSRASASHVKYITVVYALPSCPTDAIISGRKAAHLSESSAISCLGRSGSVPRPA